MNLKYIEKAADLIKSIIEQDVMSPLVDDHLAVEPGEMSGTRTLSVPGYDREDIKVTHKNNYIYIYIEGDLKKQFKITSSVDKDDIKIEIDKGVLTIHFNKNKGGREQEINIT